MNDLKDIYTEIFTNTITVKELWDSRFSNDDIISISSSFQVRNKYCNGERSVELISSSQFGLFTTQLCLITNESFVFPRKGVPYDIIINLRESGYTIKSYLDEHDVTAAAFSITALTLAIQKQDADFKTNGHKMEMVVTTDGSISCYKKGLDMNSGLAFASPSAQMDVTSLDNEVVSIYKFNNGNLGVYSTPISEEYYLLLKEKRRLEIFTVE